LALELLSYARNRLQCTLAFVLFDSWDPSQKLLKRIRDDGWDFVCQRKKKRSLNGRPVRADLQPPSWQAVGTLSEWPDGTLSGCYRFQHTLYRQVLAEWLGALQRMQVHRRMRERLEQRDSPQTPTITTQLARHFVQGHASHRAVTSLH
jgi:hypothetical protein